MRAMVTVAWVGCVLGVAPEVFAKGWPDPQPIRHEKGIETSDPVDPAVLAAVTPGRWLRVTTADGAVVVARFVAVQDDHLVLDRPARRIPSASVRRVQLRGRAAKTGALVVGGLGAVLLGALAASVAPLTCESACRGNESMSAGVSGALVGGALGASAGAVIGTAFTEWREPRRARRAETLPLPPPLALGRHPFTKQDLRAALGDSRSAFDPPAAAEPLRLRATLSW